MDIQNIVSILISIAIFVFLVAFTARWIRRYKENQLPWNQDVITNGIDIKARKNEGSFVVFDLIGRGYVEILPNGKAGQISINFTEKPKDDN